MRDLAVLLEEAADELESSPLRDEIREALHERKVRQNAMQELLDQRKESE